MSMTELADGRSAASSVVSSVATNRYRPAGSLPALFCNGTEIGSASGEEETSTVTALAERLFVRPSTLMSRFARAGLPSPKNYLAAVRRRCAARRPHSV